jgi:hypothetical protein
MSRKIGQTPAESSRASGLDAGVPNRYGGFKKVCAFNQQQIGGSGLSGRDWARASERVRKEEKRV